MSLNFSRMNSGSTSKQLPWISIWSGMPFFPFCSAEPHANFLPNTLAAALVSTPKCSSPRTTVMCFFLLRVLSSIVMHCAYV